MLTSAHGISIPETLAEAVRPDTTALIVYDMQAGILRQLPHGADVLARVLKVLELARAAGVRVFFMRHMSLPRKLAGTFQLRQMMLWQGKASPDEVSPWFLRNSPAFALAPELAVRDDEAILDKIEVLRHGKVRRAKLYYLRGRTGRAARIKERRVGAPLR